MSTTKEYKVFVDEKTELTSPTGNEFVIVKIGGNLYKIKLQKIADLSTGGGSGGSENLQSVLSNGGTATFEEINIFETGSNQTLNIIEKDFSLENGGFFNKTEIIELIPDVQDTFARELIQVGNIRLSSSIDKHTEGGKSGEIYLNISTISLEEGFGNTFLGLVNVSNLDSLANQGTYIVTVPTPKLGAYPTSLDVIIKMPYKEVSGEYEVATKDDIEQAILGIDLSGKEDVANKGTILGNLTSTTIYAHAKGVVDYIASLGYQTASMVNSLITSALASFKTSEFLDATSSIQGQINGKQETLIAGTNITIVGNTISSSGAGSTVLKETITTDKTLTSSTSQQDIFNNPINVVTGETYTFRMNLEMEGLSATNGTIQLAFDGGTCVFDWISYNAIGTKGNLLAQANTATVLTVDTSVSTALNSANTGVVAKYTMTGMMKITTGGTLYPQAKMSIAAASTIKKGTFIRLET